MDDPANRIPHDVLGNDGIARQKQRQLDVQRRFQKMRDETAGKENGADDEPDQHRAVFAFLVPAVLVPAAAAVAVLVMPVFVTAAFAVFAALAVLVLVMMLMMMLVTAAFAVLMMLVFHKNLPNIQWLLNHSTGGRKKNARSFAQMIQAEVEDLFDMLVGKRVEHILPLAAKVDKVR